MYAIAHYSLPENGYVPTCGGMQTLIIRDLKTHMGIYRRALRMQNRNGRGKLFAYEVWRAEDHVYAYNIKPLVFEVVEGDRCPITNTPFLVLAEAHNAHIPA